MFQTSKDGLEVLASACRETLEMNIKETHTESSSGAKDYDEEVNKNDQVMVKSRISLC